MMMMINDESHFISHILAYQSQIKPNQIISYHFTITTMCFLFWKDVFFLKDWLVGGLVFGKDIASNHTMVKPFESYVYAVGQGTLKL